MCREHEGDKEKVRDGEKEREKRERERRCYRQTVRDKQTVPVCACVWGVRGERGRIVLERVRAFVHV